MEARRERQFLNKVGKEISLARYHLHRDLREASEYTCAFQLEQQSPTGVILLCLRNTKEAIWLELSNQGGEW